MPDILNMLATLHGLGPDDIVGQPYGGEQPGGGINNLPGFTPAAPPAAVAPDLGTASNIMQALAPQPAAPDPTAAPAAAPAPAPAPAAPVTPPAAAQPRQKHSILDILGGIADAVATAGGAKAQYQPTLDAALARTNAAEDRTNALQDRQRQINMDDLKMQLMRNQAETASTDAEKGREGNAIQYVQAVQAAGGDASAAWQKAAGLAGVSPERQAIIGQMIAADPKNEHGTLEGLDALRNGIEEYNTAPIQAYNPKTGQYEIVQVGKHGGKNITTLDDGFTIPSNSSVQVDAGGVKELRDPRTGRLLARTTVGVSPDTAATIAGQDRRQAAGDATRTDLANIKAAGAKGGKGGSDDPYGSYVGARSGVVGMIKGVQDLISDPNLNAATGYIAGGIDTPSRQRIDGKIKALEGQAVPVAVALLKASGVRNPAQKEVIATSQGLLGDLKLLRQSTGDFKDRGAAAIARLQQRVSQLDDTAQRTGIAGGGQPAAAPAPTGRRPILPAPAGARRAAPQPTIRNW